MNKSQMVLGSSFDLESVQVNVGLPGLIPEQQLFYRSRILTTLKALANRIDLRSLGSVNITMFYAAEIDKRKLDESFKARGHIAAGYVSHPSETEGPARAHVILSLASLAGLLDNEADDHDWCVQVLAGVLGLATSSFIFDQRYGLFWRGCPHDRWNEIGRDCYLAFAASFHTNGIGSDTEVGLRKQLMKAGAEVITACSEWIKVAEKAPEDVDHGYSAWDLSEVYSAYFISRANWLGVRAAKCKSVHPDTMDNIALGVPGWHHRFDETILCIHRKWISNADALAEFTSLAELLLEVTLVDVQKRYPEVYSEMADCMTSDGWPAMYIWPVPKH